jgi:hypothetical protein
MTPDAIPPALHAAPWSTLGSVALALALALAAFLLGGCASITRQLDQFPAANAETVHYTRTGKFSSTTITVKGYSNDGRETRADELTVRHSNAWMPNLEFVAKGYRRIHAPSPAASTPAEAPNVPPAAPAAPTLTAAPAAPTAP